MKKTVNARGLSCPQPVLLAKGAIAEADEVTVIVDNEIAVENIRRLAGKLSCDFSVKRKEEGIWDVELRRTGAAAPGAADAPDLESELSCGVATAGKAGPYVVVLADNRMGRGDDSLGDILIRAFMDTLMMIKPLPTTVVCYNAGVKLAAQGSAVLEDLQQLGKAGVNILVCGTCLKHFGIVEQLGVGRVSNMYEILETLAGASRIVRP